MDKFDDLIRKGEDIKAMRYFAKEYYDNGKMGQTRKFLIERVADENDKLVAENQRLKEENQQLIEANEQYNITYSEDADKIHRLTNALRKCIPGTLACNFCEGTAMTGHKANCEYIKLIGG